MYMNKATIAQLEQRNRKLLNELEKSRERLYNSIHHNKHKKVKQGRMVVIKEDDEEELEGDWGCVNLLDHKDEEEESCLFSSSSSDEEEEQTEYKAPITKKKIILSFS